MTADSPAIPAFTAAFPAADEVQWLGLVGKVLKGGKFERLIGETSDGIAIQPLYPRAAGDAPRAFSATPGQWNVLARVDHPDAASANALAVADLADGANALQLVFAGSIGALGFGLATDANALRLVLDGIDPAAIAFELDLSPGANDVPEALADVIIASGLNPARARVSFGLDPIGAMALSGAVSPAWAETAPAFAAKVSGLAARGFTGPFCVADGRVVHAAGGSEAQELAYMIATALAYLRTLEQAGETLESAREKISFRVSTDADQFLSIAKLRALRALWAQVEQACGLAPRPVQIHAETAWRMMTRRDPWVNLLRATVAAFSAGVGGADRISVLPFTQALGLPDASARRLARNTQLILLEEANIAKVADPAAGSGGIEALTQALCDRAWALFQGFEKAGGIGNAAVRQSLAAQIADVHAQRMKNIASRREALTGVSEFPNIHERAVDVLVPLPPSLRSGAGLTPLRNAEAFEALRDRAENAVQRPRIFLANFGPLAAFNARAAFARNLFEAGGIEAVSNDGFETPQDMADAFIQSGAKIACICSSDALYAEAAPACAMALGQAGAKMIYLAGRGGENEARQLEAGITRYAYAGCDAIALLDEALTICLSNR